MHRRLRTFVAWAIEFGPTIGFFTSLYIRGGESKEGFLASTSLFVILTAISLIVAFIIQRRIALFPLIAGVFVIVFGTIAVHFHNPLIFMTKDTVYNGAFGLLLLAGILHNRGYLKHLFGALFDMSERGWYLLSLRWTFMFFLLALGNEIMWRNFSQGVWVDYKLLSTVATLVFGLYQITLARRYRNPGSSRWGMRAHV